MIKRHQKKYGTIEIIITHEEHVLEGLGAKVLEFTPEFRLHPPKEVPAQVEAEEIPPQEVVIPPEEIPQSEVIPTTVEGVTEDGEEVETVGT